MINAKALLLSLAFVLIAWLVAVAVRSPSSRAGLWWTLQSMAYPAESNAKQLQG